MKLLCLDTSTDACTVALGLGGGRVFAEWSDEPRVHARRVLGMVDALLRGAGVTLAALDAIAVGLGPGSFTGVRIGASVAQGLAFAAGRPVVPLSSLAMLAARYVMPPVAPGPAAEDRPAAAGAAPERGAAGGGTVVVVAQDARMGEVYWSAYRGCGVDALLDPLVPDRLDPPQAVPELLRRAGVGGRVGLAAGSAFLLEQGALAAAVGALRVEEHALPAAEDALALAARMVQSGMTVPPEKAVPVYFRSPV